MRTAQTYRRGTEERPLPVCLQNRALAPGDVVVGRGEVAQTPAPAMLAILDALRHLQVFAYFDDAGLRVREAP